MRRRRKVKKLQTHRNKYTRQRDKSKIMPRDYHIAELLPVSKKILDKPRRRTYSQTKDKNRANEKEIRHDLRRITKNPYLRKQALRYGSQDKVAHLLLHNRTKAGKPYKLSPRRGFRDPKRVEICKRRRARREQLFKMGKAGKGRRIRSKKHYNEYSELRC